jgi:hypothetical protein
MTFRACSSPCTNASKNNLHLQYLAKSQSTQHCQSLITLGSDHPPVLEPHMVLTWLAGVMSPGGASSRARGRVGLRVLPL